jgi:hypothetical protein
MWKNT